MSQEVPAKGQGWISEAEVTRVFESDAYYSPQPKFAHELFEMQAACAPHQLAVACLGRQLSYGALNTQANRLAQQLRSLGVGADTLVAISVERSLEMVVAILAVLKAGGAYVPLDPAYPKERLAIMFSDARPSLLLTQAHVVRELPGCEAQVLFLDQASTGSEGEQPDPTGTAGVSPAVLSDLAYQDFDGLRSPEDLAYVIYTSGSMGWPKGVMITHGNLSQYLQSMRGATGISGSDVCLHTASISFSSSVRQLMLPLSVGASVVVAITDEIRDPIALFRTIKQLGVTVIDIVPSYWRSCLEQLASLPAEARADLLKNNLRLILSASEPLWSDVPRSWRFGLGHQAQLINMFGQTETTGIVATHQISSSNESKACTVPIGQPINDVRIYLLDDQLRLVAAGSSGEICIGGPTVGRGYLNHPELTAEKFARDPFTESSDARLYRTGDLGRLCADGTLEFQGRMDNQVKIRGHRVEPAEIESALLQHSGVREVVVSACEDQPGNSRLVAYVAAQRAAAPSIKGRERYRLPNNLAVVHQNKHETDFFYQQIFVDQTNFRHGLSLEDGACVFDVGANIGLFSLFVQQIRRNVRIYAFEPIPAIFETLQVNASLYGNEFKLFQCGLAEEAKEVEFTFYPKSTSQSGRYGDETDEREVLRSIIANAKHGNGNSREPVEQYLDALVESRVSGQKVVCRLKTLSEIIREEGVERIDLLKIDVEKSEADVLAGIAEKDWSKIRQIVIEAHDVDGQLAWLTQLLRDRGYSVIAEQDQYLGGSNLYNVYATRSQTTVTAKREGAPYQVPILPDTILSTGDLRRHLQRKLPDYLVPTEFVLVESLPRLPNGKVDRQSLKSIDRQQTESGGSFRGPLSPIEEQLARIWSEVLKRDSVSTNDNFFDLGGDSILVMQIVSRAARVGLRLTPKQIFKHQTIAELAASPTIAETVFGG